LFELWPHGNCTRCHAGVVDLPLSIAVTVRLKYQADMRGKVSAAEELYTAAVRTYRGIKHCRNSGTIEQYGMRSGLASAA
jgi:hypothetical protein